MAPLLRVLKSGDISVERRTASDGRLDWSAWRPEGAGSLVESTLLLMLDVSAEKCDNMAIVI